MPARRNPFNDGDDQPRRGRSDEDGSAGEPGAWPAEEEFEVEESAAERRPDRLRRAAFDPPRHVRRRKRSGFRVCDLLGLDYALQSIIALTLATAFSAMAVADTRDLYLFSIPFWIWGCAAYASLKGYSEWLGIAGLLTFLGLVVIAFLPYRKS